jgi:hypothetical protein
VSREVLPDVIFISFEEPNADENFARVLSLAPHAKRLHGIKGVFNAWSAAAQLVTTPYFFLVEGDNWILDGFELRQPEPETNNKIYYWPARNAVNKMEWFNGCLKFLAREAVSTMSRDAVDFFHSIKGYRQPMTQVATETRFNASPFLAWRCGFRECAKLAAGSYNTPRAQEVLKTWQSVGADALNGTWCIFGARMGANFGRRNKGRDEIRLVNDMDWLKAQFALVEQNHKDGNLWLA